jgi:hypothetical protein
MTLEDFKANIGKRIFRDSNKCPCETCKDIKENGILVRDTEHAEYMFQIQEDFAMEGLHLNYRVLK